MSYNIEYNMNGTYSRSSIGYKSAKKFSRALLWAVVAIIGCYFLFFAGTPLVYILLPGATEKTSMAVQSMLEDISSGIPVAQAVKTFVIQHIIYAR